MDKISRYKCNVADSMYLAIQNDDILEEGNCYVNSFIMMPYLRAYADVKTSCIKGCIGYILSSDGERKAAVRHSWLKIVGNQRFSEEQAIDVTFFTDGYGAELALRCDYVDVATFSVDKWLKLTENNKGRPCIENLVGEDEIVRSLRKEGYEILG